MAGEIPPVTVEVAFDGGPFATSYTWTDISAWVREFAVKRGRSYELDRIEASTLDLTLDNADGRFTPMKDWRTELLSGNVATGTDTLGTTSGFFSAASVTLASGTSDPYSGSRALQYQGTTGAVTSLVYNGATAVKPGNRYVASVWIRKTPTSGYATFPQRLVIRWRDASGALISDSNGANWDGTSTSWVQISAEGIAPPNAATATLIIGGLATVSEAWVYWTDSWSLAEAAPYYPNVIPRRRVRVRTANLLPKDTATGGDISRSSINFSADHVSGQSKVWNSTPGQSGGGSVLMNFVASGDGLTDYNSSIYCGYFTSEKWAAWTNGTRTYYTTRLVPRGLARVVAGKTYTASGWYRMRGDSADSRLTARLRWYKDDGTFYGTSASTVISARIGQWVYWSVTGIAGGAVSSGVTLAGIEIGTPGSTGGVIGHIDSLQIEEGSTATTWTPGGSIFSGYVEKWPLKLSGLTSEVTVTAVDGFNILGTTEMQRPMRQHILSTGPWGYWPLTEGAEATTVANLADDKNPAALRASKYGAATAAFGAPSLVTNDDGTSWSLTNVSSNQGTVLDLTQNGSLPFPSIGSEFSVSFWCLPTRPSAGTTVTLFRSTSEDGYRCAELVLDSDGLITVYVAFPSNGSNDGGITHSSTSEYVLSSSTPSLITLSITAGEGSLWINDTWATSTADVYGPAVATTLRQPKYITVGGNLSWTYAQDFASGRYGHVAVWDRALTSEHREAYWIGAGMYGSSKGPFREDETARLSRLVRYAGFVGETAFDTAASNILGVEWDTGQTAVEEIQTTAEDASGYVFMDGDGCLTYHNRKRRQGAPVRFTLGEATGLPYGSDLDLQVDEDRIVNEVAFTRPSGASGVIRDDGSMIAHGKKTKSVELRVTSDAEVLDASYWILNRYKDPVIRCDEVTLEATACPALFPVVLGVEIGDRITLGDLPAASPASSLAFYVEAISTTVKAEGVTPEWVTVLSLSPASLNDVWVLEDDTLGILDQTTNLAF